MAKSTKSTTDSGDQFTCGPLKPLADDQEIAAGTSGQEVLSKVMLLCDDDTGAFFFRSDLKLYLRVVRTGGS